MRLLFIKEAVIIIFFSFIAFGGICQISYNGSLEFERGDHYPRLWGVDKVKEFDVSLDTTVAFRGKKSLLIKPTPDYVDKISRFTYFQQINLAALHFQHSIRVVQYIKSDSMDSVKIRTGISRGACAADMPTSEGSQTIEPINRNGEL